MASVLLTAFAASAAAAAEYTVDSTGDQADQTPGTNGCTTSFDTCTLRAAIEESNASTSVNDTIGFSAALDGEIGDTIALATPLPAITDRVRIEASPGASGCETDFAAVPGPCVGVHGPTAGVAFQLEAGQVVIRGIAITGAQTAIRAVGAPGLEASNNWLGVKLDGSAGSNGTGIFVDQNSNDPTIGGSSSIARNVIANSTASGLDIDGADDAVIRGNYFGVDPTGMAPMPNGDNIEITDALSGPNRAATGNEIGATLSAPDLETPACDGACNLISGATSNGIDMEGVGLRAPPTGPTTIQGNHIGLNAVGAAAVPNGWAGILIGGGADALIGGEDAGDGNLLNGGSFGVRASDVKRLVVEGNMVGVDPSGSLTLAPPTEAGISVASGAITDEEDAAIIIENLVSMIGGRGISLFWSEALVAGNEIGRGGDEPLSGGAIGMLLYSSGNVGNLIAENLIEGASHNGIRIEGSHNLIVSNLIQGSGGAGIRLTSGTGNEIGGDSEADENAILKSGGNAIEVVETNIEQNEFARNFGWDNPGLFIDLGGDGAGNTQFGPNDGIQAPTIGTATPSGVSGAGARPDATIRVFSKATSSPGEIEGFLGEAIADEGGDWSLTYEHTIADATMIAASQTAFEGTSELAFSTTTAAVEPDSGDSGGDAGGGGGPEQAPADAPLPAASAPIALLRGKVRVKGSSVLVRVACPRGACRGVLKIFGRNKARFPLIGKRRFRVADGARKVLRVRLNRRGRALLRQAGRRGLKVTIGGKGVRSRAVRLR